MNINKKIIITVLVFILVLLLIFTIYILLIKPILNGELSFNVSIKENFDAPIQRSLKITNPTELSRYLPSPLVITDIGYPKFYQGLANLQGLYDLQNLASLQETKDYIRYSGNDGAGTLFTALYKDTSQYSTIEIVLGADNKPYPNLSNMLQYSLYNQKNDRTIILNSSYAVGVYNRLNGTNYTGAYIIITRQFSLKITNSAELPLKLRSPLVITDFGYPDLYQGLANLQVLNNIQNIANVQETNDYIRYCGNKGAGTLYTALYGDTLDIAPYTAVQYSTIEIVLGADNKPYPNKSIDMPKYSLYNPNNDRNITLNSSYAVGVYNRLNGTNYTGKNVIITKQTITMAPNTTRATTTAPNTTRATTTAPNTTLATTTAPNTTLAATTTTQVPATTKFNCSFHMGNILNNKAENIQSCNSDSNCYYIGNNCWDYSNSSNIAKVNLTCSYTQKNPGTITNQHELLFGCNNNDVDDKNYYIIQSIDYKDKDKDKTQYLYQLSNDGDISSKSNIPFIYKGSLHNIDNITVNTNNIDNLNNINITDIKGNIQNFTLTNNKERITTDIYIKSDAQAVGHMKELGDTINGHISVVAS